MSKQTAVPWQIPAAGSPTPRELRLLREWGQLAAKTIAHSLAGLGACPIACSLVRATVIDDWVSPAHTVSLNWGAPGPRWQLRLTIAAAEDVLAGLLGCQKLMARDSWSRSDRAVLLLQLADLAERAETDMQLPVSSNCEIILPPDAPLPWESVTVDLELQLRVHDRTHELHLLTSFVELRPHLERTTSGPKAITADGVAHAVVEVEAVLPGPELSADELLHMQPGDVLLLNTGQQEAALRSRGVVIGRGRVGAKNGRLAVNLREVSRLQ